VAYEFGGDLNVVLLGLSSDEFGTVSSLRRASLDIGAGNPSSRSLLPDIAGAKRALALLLLVLTSTRRSSEKKTSIDGAN
jgi:hypothetical protein